MDKLSVFMALPLPDEVERDLGGHFTLTRASGSEWLAELMAQPLVQAVLLVGGTVRLGADVIFKLPPGVRAIATYSVGLDHIDLHAAAARGIAVFNTPDVLDDAVAEAALLLMLGAARRATESIALIRSRQWAGWSATQLNGVQLRGRTLGIFGMGRIGRRIAALAGSFGMAVAYSNRRPLAPALAGEARYHRDLRTLVGEVDVLLLAAPSTADTRGVVNAALLVAAKPGLIIVNIGRGDLVNDDDLIDALQGGRVWAAGLDVFAGEPNLNPRYFDLPNVFMLPHIGSSTVEARRAMGRVLITGLLGWQAGEAPVNRVV